MWTKLNTYSRVLYHTLLVGTTAQRYQEVSKEAFLRYHDDVKRHFNDKLCKKNQRQTGINNKSGPLPLVARAQEIQRKILINEATISVGGDNENDADDDDEADDDDDDEEDDFAPSSNDKETEEKADETAAPVSSDVRPKKKAKVDDGMKTKNSKPTQSNPRGGIAVAPTEREWCETVLNGLS